jgi:hypothetical protein
MEPTGIHLTPKEVRDTEDIIETLLNLNYLTSEDAASPERVRQYALISEGRLRAMVEILNSANKWNASDH